MEIRFDNKVALVTGAGSGLGAEIATELAASGAAVVVADLNGETAKSVADHIVAEGGKAEAAIGDVSDPSTVEGMVKTAMGLGGLHLLVNNAGISGPERTDIGEFPLKWWKKVVDINMNATFLGMHFGIPAILKSGGGAVVNMASVLAGAAYAGTVGYVATKHAVLGMTKTAALEYANRGVRVNAVAPGYIDTPLLHHMGKEELDALIGMHPIGRLGKPEEVAALVLFLLSDKASFITGSCHLADGGYSAL